MKRIQRALAFGLGMIFGVGGAVGGCVAGGVDDSARRRRSRAGANGVAAALSQPTIVRAGERGRPGRLPGARTHRRERADRAAGDAERLWSGRAAERVCRERAGGDRRTGRDDRHRRRAGRSRRRGRPRGLPQAVRAARVHERRRLLQEGEPERHRRARCRRPTRAGPARSCSTSRWRRRSARAASCCSSRPRPRRRPTWARP